MNHRKKACTMPAIQQVFDKWSFLFFPELSNLQWYGVMGCLLHWSKKYLQTDGSTILDTATLQTSAPCPTGCHATTQAGVAVAMVMEFYALNPTLVNHTQYAGQQLFVWNRCEVAIDEGGTSNPQSQDCQCSGSNPLDFGRLWFLHL